MDFAAIQTRPLLVIIGPSGCGKSTLVRRLSELGVLRVHPTWTTRPPREDEDPTDMRLEHRFVGRARFASLEREGFFLGTTQMFGLPHYYGLPRLELEPEGPIDAVMFRAPLVEELRALIPWLLVYQVEANLEEASDRIVERSVDDDEVLARTTTNQGELDEGKGIADRVFTNDGELDHLVDSVVAALLVDYGPATLGLPAPPPRPRSVGEKLAIAVVVIVAVLVTGAFVFLLLMAMAISQWGNNK